MTVKVKLFATLRRYNPGLKMGEALTIDLPDGATVRVLLGQLGVPEQEVKVVFVNGLFRGLDDMLSDGAEVGLFPAVGGG